MEWMGTWARRKKDRNKCTYGRGHSRGKSRDKRKRTEENDNLGARERGGGKIVSRRSLKGKTLAKGATWERKSLKGGQKAGGKE